MPMNATDIIESMGGIAATARACGVKPPSVCEWKVRGTVPAERCIDIERASDGRLTVETMRPDLDWTRDAAGRPYYAPRVAQSA